MAQVFISYSRKDLSFVEQLAADLKSAGFDVWYDVSGLRGGSRWRFEIENAIRNSESAIFVLSPDSIASEWVEREFLFSSNLKRKLIPLMYRYCELPLSYLNLNYIDVQGDKYRQNFDEILGALSSEHGASTSQKEWTNEPSQPPSRKITLTGPALFAMALVLVGLLIGSTLLVKWYSSQPSPNFTETIPASPIASTSTGTAIMTLTPTSTSPVSTITSVAKPTGNYWISYTSDESGNRDIFLLNLATGEKKAVIADPSHDKVGTWSHDGKLLAFESNRNGTYYQIYLFNAEQGSVKPLTKSGDCNNWAPAWAPNGEKLVFYSNCEKNQRNIYIMNRDGSGREKLTSGPGENRFPVFSPDGNGITFTSSRNGKDQILLMDSDGRNQRVIADGCSSTFSPDGKWLWFSARCDDSDIKRIQVDGTNLSTVGSMFGQNPSVSPDGQWVVFQANNDLWIMGVDGSNLKQLTSGSALDSSPSWRP